MSVMAGDMVKREQTIGTSGNTGTTQYYAKENGGYHLHFEVIDTGDSGGKINWHTEGGTGIPGDAHRKDPDGYLGHSKTLEGTTDDVTEKGKDSIVDRIQVTADYDRDRSDALRPLVSIDGIYVGYLSDDSREIRAKVVFDNDGNFTVR